MYKHFWQELCDAVAKKEGFDDSWTPPTPEDIAGALEAEEHWIREAVQEATRRLAAIIDSAGKDDDLFGKAIEKALSENNLHSMLDTLQIFTLFLAAPFTKGGSAAVIARMMPLIHLLYEAGQEIGASIPHPLAPLISAWAHRPELLRPNVDAGGKQHRNGIIPTGLLPQPPATVPAQLALTTEEQIARLPIGRVERTEVQLPLLAEILDQQDVPCTPLILANAAGFRSLQPGRGARMDKRIFIFGLLRMARDQRRPEKEYEWRPPLRELRDLLFPPSPTTGKSSYRPSVHGQALHDALTAINSARIILPDGRTWFPMITRSYPNLSNMDQQAVLEIVLPTGSDRGPQIDRQALIAAGVISDPAFDLEIALAYLWDDAKARNGGHRIYANRPKAVRNAQGYILNATGQVVTKHGHQPVTDWSHPQAVLTGRHERHPQADRVRVLTADDRHRMAYGPRKNKNKQQISNERRTADRILTGMEIASRILIERDVYDDRTGKHGWRILQTWSRE